MAARTPGFAKRLYEALERADINQSELARRLGVRPQSVQAWVAGESEPRGYRFENLAKTLGVSEYWLKTGLAQDAVQEPPAPYQEENAGNGAIVRTRQHEGRWWERAIRGLVLQKDDRLGPFFDASVRLGEYRIRFDFYSPALAADFRVLHPAPKSGGPSNIPERLRGSLARMAVLRAIDEGMVPEGVPVKRLYVLMVLLAEEPTGEAGRQQDRIDREMRQIRWEADHLGLTVRFVSSPQEAADYILTHSPGNLVS